LRLSSWLHDLYQTAVSPYNERLPWIPFAVDASRKVIQRDGAYAVLSTSPPPATHIAAERLVRRFGLPWIADFRDPLADNPFRPDERAQRFYSRLERRIMARAKAVLANTEPLADTLKTRYPEMTAKVIVLPNGYDPEEMIEATPISQRPYRVIAHVGTLYGGRHPGLLLQSIERLLASGRIEPGTVRIELTGDIQDVAVPLDRPPFSTLQGAGCLIIDAARVPRADAHRRMSQADYLLLLDVNERGSSIQVPAKIFDYIRIGRPILAFTSRQSPAADILSRCGVPHTFVWTDATSAEVDAAVESFLQLSPEPVRAATWFWDTYNGKFQAGIVAGLLDRAAAQGVQQHG
jgi:glycosyltransferase involved in cell wall biosynthesis